MTRNGGHSWTEGPASPSGRAPDYLTCLVTTCIFFDQSVTAGGSGWTAWFSTDGGLRWRQGTHPASVRPVASNQLPAPGSASCASRQPIVISCPTARQCWTAGFYLSSGDGGVPFLLATRDGGVG